MKLKFVMLFGCVLVLLAPTAWPEATIKLTILHLSDTHSMMVPIGPKQVALQGTLGGAVRAAAVIKERGALASAQGRSVLLFHAGDLGSGGFIFNRFSTAPEFQLLNSLGFDAVTIGNHDFDLGAAALARALQHAYGFAPSPIPLLSGNFEIVGSNPEAIELLDYVHHATMINVAGLRIGVFGLTSPDIPVGADDDVKIRPDTVAIAAAEVSALRNDGADVVIFLSHLGWDRDKAIANGMTGIDVIVGGHDHTVFYDTDGAPTVRTEVANGSDWKTLIVQAGAFYRYLGELRLAVTVDDFGQVTVALDPENPGDPKAAFKLNPIDADTVGHGPFPDPQVASIAQTINKLVLGVQGFGPGYGAAFTKPIATASALIDREVPADGPNNSADSVNMDTGMGNLIADSFRGTAQADLAILPNGVILTPLYPGKIVGADLLAALPLGIKTDPLGINAASSSPIYGYKLARVALPGWQLELILELTTRMKLGDPQELAELGISYHGDDYAMQVSGVTYAYSKTVPRLFGIAPNDTREQRLVKMLDYGKWHVYESGIRIGGGAVDRAHRYTVAMDENFAAVGRGLGLISAGDTEVSSNCSIYEVIRDYVSIHGLAPYEPEGRVRRSTTAPSWSPPVTTLIPPFRSCLWPAPL